jgi:hypothetical protein
MLIEEITLCILSTAILLLTWRISRLERILSRNSTPKPAANPKTIISTPLVVRKLRTEEQKKAASKKRKEWWDRKKAAEVEPAAIKD